MDKVCVCVKVSWKGIPGIINGEEKYGRISIKTK